MLPFGSGPRRSTRTRSIANSEKLTAAAALSAAAEVNKSEIEIMLTNSEDKIQIRNAIQSIGVGNLETQKSPHPLLIHHIAQEILGYLSYSKLKKCRLVCQVWNEASANNFRKKSEIVFNSEKRLTEFLESYTDIDNIEPPFTNYRFTSNSNINPLSSKLAQFLDRFGSTHVKYVYFDKFNFVENGISYHFELFKKFKGVEELVLDCRHAPLGSNYNNVGILDCFQNLKVFKTIGDFSTDSEMANYGVLIAKILTSVHKLERISTILKSDKKKLYNYPYREFLPTRQNLDTQINARSGNTMLAEVLISTTISKSLNKLDYLSEFEVTYLARLAYINSFDDKVLSLKTLNFCLFNFQKHDLTDAIQKFFAKESSTLVNLKVTFGLEDQITTFGVHDFPRLRNLAIYGSKSANHLNFLSGCPSLETLFLVQCILPRNFQDILIDPPLPKLRTFIEHDVKVKGKRCGLVLTSKVCNEFPQLRKLKLDNINDESLSLICKSLVQLEELVILNAKVTDSGVTGISKSVLKKYGSMSPEKKLQFQQAAKKRLPYIADLKNLRKLELGSYSITDISISLGILDCLCVRSLKIFSPKFTGKALKNIVDKMSLLALCTICCYRIPDSALEYARQKLDNPETVLLNLEKGPKTNVEVAMTIKTYGVVHLELPRS